jgi:hypothetical protein
MTPEVWAAVIGGVAGLATGAVSSLIAPWAHWSVEKRRTDRERQHALLDSWRAGIARLEDGAENALDTPWYETLRPHLSEDALRQLESPRNFVVPSDSGRGARNLFSGEVDRIERE